MRRAIIALASAAVLLTALAGPASATKPIRGCSDDFAPWVISDFRAYMNSQLFYDSLSPAGQALAPDILAIVNSDPWVTASDAIDKNGDQVLCIKQKPPTPGNLHGWIFNAVDNTAAS